MFIGYNNNRLEELTLKNINNHLNKHYPYITGIGDMSILNLRDTLITNENFKEDFKKIENGFEDINFTAFLNLFKIIKYVVTDNYGGNKFVAVDNFLLNRCLPFYEDLRKQGINTNIFDICEYIINSFEYLTEEELKKLPETIRTLHDYNDSKITLYLKFYCENFSTLDSLSKEDLSKVINNYKMKELEEYLENYMEVLLAIVVHLETMDYLLNIDGICNLFSNSISADKMNPDTTTINNNRNMELPFKSHSDFKDLKNVRLTHIVSNINPVVLLCHLFNNKYGWYPVKQTLKDGSIIYITTSETEPHMSYNDFKDKANIVISEYIELLHKFIKDLHNNDSYNKYKDLKIESLVDYIEFLKK